MGKENTPTESLKGYFAGFVDGEGAICIFKKGTNRRDHGCSLQISQVDPRPLELFKYFYGGSLHLCKNSTARLPNSKPIWKYILVGPKLTRCLEDIEKFLVVKREKAALALLFRRLLKNGGRQNRYSDAEREKLNAVVIEFKKRA